MRRFTTLLAVVALATLGLVACGDDDDTGTAAPGDPAAENGDGGIDPANAEFCAVGQEIDEGDGPPTDEDIERWRDAVPEDAEIRDDVEFAAGRVLDDGLMAAFGDPEVGQAFERIEAWEAEHCGREPGGDMPEPEPQEPAEDATIVNVSATEYAFDVEGAVPSGKVAFVMTNDGEEPHHLDIVRFNDGVTPEQARQAAEEQSDELFEIIDEDTELAEQTTSVEVGPGGEAVLNVDLPPGTYGLACFVSAPDGRPHFFHGMFTVFTVE